MAYDMRDIGKSADWFSTNARNHICVTVDLTATGWKEVASHEVFTVSGTVRMYLWLICTEVLTSGGSATIKYGAEGGQTGALFSNKTAGNFGYVGIYDRTNTASLPDFMIDQWPDDQGWTSNNSINLMWSVVATDSDVGYTIGTAEFTDGTLEFHCVWEPLSAGATVVAGTGGSL